jgi:hypothetical protein
LAYVTADGAWRVYDDDHGESPKWRDGLGTEYPDAPSPAMTAADNAGKKATAVASQGGVEAVAVVDLFGHPDPQVKQLTFVTIKGQAIPEGKAKDLATGLRLYLDDLQTRADRLRSSQ